MVVPAIQSPSELAYLRINSSLQFVLHRCAFPCFFILLFLEKCTYEWQALYLVVEQHPYSVRCLQPIGLLLDIFEI